MKKENKTSRKAFTIIFYSLAIVLAVLNGFYGNELFITTAHVLSQIFINLFKFIAVPIIAVSVIVTLASIGENSSNKKIGKRTLFYTLSTTILAASLAACLYSIFSPANYSNPINDHSIVSNIESKGTYLDNFISIFPSNLIQPFIDGKVLTVLFIALVIGFAINKIEDAEARSVITKFFMGFQKILFVMIKWLITILPIGIFAFITECIIEFQKGVELGGLGTYFVTIISANLIQMFVILPLLLLLKGLNPLKIAKGMFKALTFAFFSKSSAATLPLTMECAEENCGVKSYVSRFVLPICTTINMNGCAAFIYITVIYIMQNNGIAITFPIMLSWILIATIAAIGNAGVPMGCFFLSASLLSSMDVSIVLLGLILPFFNVIDMLETSLNVWSDSCVANMVNKDINDKYQKE